MAGEQTMTGMHLAVEAATALLLGREGAMLQQLWIIGTGCQHHSLFFQAKILQLLW